MSGFNSQCKHWSQYVTSHPGQLSLAISSWIGTMITIQRAVPCGWGVKAGMVRVRVAGKTVWSPCYTQAISEHFKDKGLIYKVQYQSISLLLLLFVTFTNNSTNHTQINLFQMLSIMHIKDLMNWAVQLHTRQGISPVKFLTLQQSPDTSLESILIFGAHQNWEYQFQKQCSSCKARYKNCRHQV